MDDRNNYDNVHGETYRYYSTQRPVDIGTFPKTEGGPTHIENFDKRQPVERGRFQAWGYIEYTAPLTKRQADDYELRSASGNADLKKRMEEQTQVVGKWEQANNIPDVRRHTWWYSDFGMFVAKDFVTPEQMEQRHSHVMEAKSRAAAPKRISEQLAEAEKKVEHSVNTSAKKQNKSHEDR